MDDPPPDDVVFAVYDPVHELWLGVNDTETGPKTFTDRQLARVAARVAEAQLRYPCGRLTVVAYHGEATTRTDDVPTTMSPRRALRKIERGEV